MGVGGELVASGLRYPRTRLAEFRAAVLADVASFAAAAGAPGFDDVAGVVAAHMTAAKAELDPGDAAVTAGTPPPPQTHYGNALNELVQAAQPIPVQPLTKVWRGAERASKVRGRSDADFVVNVAAELDNILDQLCRMTPKPASRASVPAVIRGRARRDPALGAL